MKKICRLLAVLVIISAGLFLASCEDAMTYNYYFNNETAYTIYVTLNKEYSLTSDLEATKYTDTITVYSSAKRTVYVKGNSVSFEWTAGDGRNNIYVYTVNNGSTVTFKERAK